MAARASLSSRALENAVRGGCTQPSTRQGFPSRRFRRASGAASAEEQTATESLQGGNRAQPSPAVPALPGSLGGESGALRSSCASGPAAARAAAAGKAAIAWAASGSGESDGGRCAPARRCRALLRQGPTPRPSRAPRPCGWQRRSGASAAGAVRQSQRAIVPVRVLLLSSRLVVRTQLTVQSAAWMLSIKVGRMS